MNKFALMLLSLVLALGVAGPGFAQETPVNGTTTVAVAEPSAPAASGFYG